MNTLINKFLTPLFPNKKLRKTHTNLRNPGSWVPLLPIVSMHLKYSVMKELLLPENQNTNKNTHQL